MSYPFQITSLEQYHEDYKKSAEDPEGFWSSVAENFQWRKSWHKVLEWNFKEPKVEWFKGSKLNITENCIDRHLKTLGDKPAIIWEPNNKQALKAVGRDIPQILLIHANRINSVYFGKLAKAMKKRGYRFITLEEALRDEAYKLPDNFIKRSGISWLHRWALDRGSDNVVPNEPRVPEFVMKYSGFSSE